MTRLGSPRRIELLRTLGKGGFGAVYLAEVHGRDDFVQRLAIKVLSVEMSADADIAARQRDEARLLGRLNHDHIVRVIDLTELDGRPAVLMEYVEGADASVLLREGPVPVKAALQIGAASASALDAAWSTPGPRTGQALRVIHRDIKPANVLISCHGGVKVLDFGIARGDFDREGQTGSVQFGTARFMAPEQWLYGESSNKVDTFALGITLVEMLTGMHMERAPLAQEAFEAHMGAVRAAVCDTTWPQRLTEGVDVLLARMLAFDPEHRPDAAQVYDALAHLVDDAPGEGIRRWARRVVPPIVAAQQARWAKVPPPQLGEGPSLTPPPPVAPDSTAAQSSLAGQAASSATTTPGSAATVPMAQVATTVPVADSEDAPPIADTLARSKPAPMAARKGRNIVPMVAGGATLLVVLVGLIGVGQLWEPGPGQPEITVEATASPLVADPAPSMAEITIDEIAEEVAPLATNAGATAPPPTAAAPATDAPGSAAEDPAPATADASAASTKFVVATDPTPAPHPSETPPPDAQPSGSGAEEAAASVGAAEDRPVDPAEDPASTTPAAQTVATHLSSTPWGARVFVDGADVGSTPLRNLPLTTGSHRVTMSKDDQTITRTITVGGRNPTSHTWTLETDQWRSSQ